MAIHRTTLHGLTQARLCELFHYDPLTGVMSRRIAVGHRGRHKAGAIVGCPQKEGGHLVVRVDGTLYLLHRLAWFYMTGEWPADQVDHEDLNKQNNIWTNLREATDAEQRQNMPMQRNNKSGHIGVSWDKSEGKWRAAIVVAGKQTHLGRFVKIEDAIAAYAKAKVELHPFSPIARRAIEPVRSRSSV